MNSKITKLKSFIILLMLTIAAINIQAIESDQEVNNQTLTPSIVTLSPHLTEIVFALGLGDNIIAVSDYSDFPKEALNYPSVASYQGANLAEIHRLKPSHILVWKGGNKDTDIEHLKSADYLVYESSVQTINDLIRNIAEIGVFLQVEDKSTQLVKQLNKHVENLLNSNYPILTAIYYLNAQPLVGLGNDPWLNNLLSLCNINNLYKSSSNSYPQLNMSDVIRKRPNIIISANSQTKEQGEQFWNEHRSVLRSKFYNVNSDALHRFTPRAIYEISSLCSKVHN